MKKIGLLVMAIVFAIGALGVGYAAWTDTIFINGTVNTGSVDLVVVETSSTYVFKDMSADNETTVVHQRTNHRPVDGITWSVVNVPPIPDGQTTCDAVASATATKVADDSIVVTFDNAFPMDAIPGAWLGADFVIHNEGSIPVKVTAEITDAWGDVELLEQVAEIWFFWWDEDAQEPVYMAGPIMEQPVQLHYCDYVYCVMVLDIPEEDQYMNLSGGFTAQINAIQWNEYADGG